MEEKFCASLYQMNIEEAAFCPLLQRPSKFSLLLHKTVGSTSVVQFLRKMHHPASGLSCFKGKQLSQRIFLGLRRILLKVELIFLELCT